MTFEYKTILYNQTYNMITEYSAYKERIISILLDKNKRIIIVYI